MSVYRSVKVRLCRLCDVWVCPSAPGTGQNGRPDKN